MTKLHGVIDDWAELIIISDRYTVIKRVVLKVFVLLLIAFVFTMLRVT